MKTTLRRISQLATLAFALAALAQFAGLVAFPLLSTTALVGGLAVASVVSLALGDYAQKPSFRVRRLDAGPDQASPDAGTPAGAPGADWTYTTRIK
jgi:membrane protein implicated in regulation of membrane protease activity